MCNGEREKNSPKTIFFAVVITNQNAIPCRSLIWTPIDPVLTRHALRHAPPPPRTRPEELRALDRRMITLCSLICHLFRNAW